MTGTVHGNTVITATAAVREPGDTQTYASDVNALLAGARKLVPDLDTRRVVRAFAGGRPVIKGTNDFFIGQSAVVPGLFRRQASSRRAWQAPRPLLNVWRV